MSITDPSDRVRLFRFICTNPTATTGIPSEFSESIISRLDIIEDKIHKNIRVQDTKTNTNNATNIDTNSYINNNEMVYNKIKEELDQILIEITSKCDNTILSIFDEQTWKGNMPSPLHFADIPHTLFRGLGEQDVYYEYICI